MTCASAKKVFVLLAPGFEEIETVTPVDILRRSGAQVSLVGLFSYPIEGSRGILITPDYSLDQTDANQIDLLILPGGLLGAANLAKEDRVLDLLKCMDAKGKFIAAICAAPIILQSAGILKGRTLTSHPSVKNRLNGVHYSEDRVVVDGNLITSQSPGTAMEFALKLVEILFSRDRMKTINKGVLARI